MPQAAAARGQTRRSAGAFLGPVLLACLTRGSRGQASQECDIVSSGPVCMNSGSNILMPGAVASGLVGHWTFDEKVPTDLSGNGLHGVGDLFHMPSPAGGGYSALFEKNFLMVPHSELMDSEDFTYSFWIFLPGGPTAYAKELPQWCPLLRKGVYSTAAEEFANAPALLLNRRTGHLRASVTTSLSSRGDGEQVDSHARVLPSRWVHVALAHHGAASKGGSSRLLIYVNGILDAMLQTQGRLESNKYPLYVGGDPFTAEDCNFKVYIDELRAYSRAVSPHELQAEAAPALAGIDPSFVHLGCLDCSLQEATRSCPQDRHICSSMELHTGGYQVAKSLGWLISGAQVWTLAAVHRRLAARAGASEASYTGLDGAPDQGLALCCEGAG